MRRKIFFLVAFLCIFIYSSTFTFSSFSIDIPPENLLQISKGEMKMITLQSVPERLDIDKKDIIDIFMQDNKTLIIKGRTKGFTSMFVLYDNGKIDQYGVTVTAAGSALINGLAEQMRVNLAPIETISITPAGDKIIVSGYIDDEKYIDYYKKIVSLYSDYIVNMVTTSYGELRIEKPEEEDKSQAEIVDIVQIDVRVVQIKDVDNLDLGVRWFPLGQPWSVSGGSQNSYQSQRVKTTTKNSQGANTYSSSKTKSGSYVDGEGPDWDDQAWARTDTIDNTSSLSKVVPDVLTQTLAYYPTVNLSNINFELIALAEDGRIKMLATPKLIVQSGKTASFLVGGEIPIAQSTGFVSSVEWKEYGTTLEISPEVVDSDSIFISLKANISELDWANGVGNYPALITKEAETRLTAKNGVTFAIAGLISQEYTDRIDKVPLLGDIPILGYLFKKKSKALVNVETIIFFTPHIIKKDDYWAMYGDPPGIRPSNNMTDYITGEEAKESGADPSASALPVMPAAEPASPEPQTNFQRREKPDQDKPRH